MLGVFRQVLIWLANTVVITTMSACSLSSVGQNQEGAIAANKLSNPTPNSIASASDPKPNQEKDYSLLINRSGKRLEVFDSQGMRIWNTTIGIGRGGLKQKKNMADLVTPTGEMTVDLILYKKSDYNKIAPNNVKRFSKNTAFRNLLDQPKGLAQLYNNMNSLDFDGNGSPDRAYGDGYIGLTSSTVVTGPKMSTFQGKPYWFSIALHGTPQPENIGKANSGGCVHLNAKTLQQLIENGWVKLGTKVKIVN